MCSCGQECIIKSLTYPKESRTESLVPHVGVGISQMRTGTERGSPRGHLCKAWVS